MYYRGKPGKASHNLVFESGCNSLNLKEKDKNVQGGQLNQVIFTFKFLLHDTPEANKNNK